MALAQFNRWAKSNKKKQLSTFYEKNKFDEEDVSQFNNRWIKNIYFNHN